MYLLGDYAFKVGEIETYEHVFKNARNNLYAEYIHCIVLERLEEEIGYKPKRIRVNQIHNLEVYISSPDSYDNFSERILKTDNIHQILSIKKNM
ncbi:hypothetical protein [uncultured Chryseobacterium sp.]|uniref:hypothetical protein n=1 Tax=uncultured Chryseobacterium sp. TaxID=259322 RepID=UPI0025EF5976|nr:hypothetical protein [uncultured Chryseobacterium sp.]